jgi:hypothetical protein
MKRVVVAICLLLTAVSLHAQDCAVRVGAVTRCLPFTRIDADGPFLVGAESELPRVVILDMTVPNSPVELGAYLATAKIQDVAISGNIVLASLGSDIDVISIADPRNPVRIGRMHTNGFYTRVTVDGTLAVAINSEFFGRYDILDLTNPAAPTLITTFADGRDDIALSGTVLFDVPGDPGRISLANRATPVRFPDSITTGNVSHHQVAASARVVVTERITLNPPSTGLSVNRVNGTNAPTPAGGFAADGILDVAVSGCRAYYITLNELHTLDISGCVGDCASCVPSDTNLCMVGGRFATTAEWRTNDGTRGAGHRIALSDNSAGFWFFGPTNTEVVFKVLDGCAVNNRYWFFAAGMTNVEVTLTVTDTKNGTVKRYVNPLNKGFETILDTGAFPCQ